MKIYLKHNEDIIKYWDYDKNDNNLLDKLSTGSNEKVWWKCDKGHSYIQSIKSKTKGIGCPVCSNKLIVKGINDLATTNPELLREWDYENNTEITPYEISKGAEKKIWWICLKCKQSYQSYAYTKQINCGCPYCSNKIIKKGLNDIFTIHPLWEKSWDYKKNKINPYTISCSSHKKVWWICYSCNNKFERAISDIENQEKVFCKNCMIKRGREKRLNTILEKSGSFIDKYPDIAKEWDYDKNSGLSPKDISYGSSIKVWWICQNGHSYRSTMSHRIFGRRCPICSKEMSISFPEKAIAFYLNKVSKKMIESYRPDFLKGKEIDIYLEDKNIGIEYDGKAWHKSIKRDIEKNKLCEKNNIKLIRVRELGCPELNSVSDDYYYQKDEKFNNLSPIIQQIIFNIYGKTLEIDVESDRFKIYEMIDYSIKEKSFESIYPDIAKEWDYEKNDNLKPSQFYAHSSRKFWWKCDKGHSYEVSLAKRADGSKCPYCSNQKILTGYNDLSSTHSYILKEWNYKQNLKNNIKPENVFAGSHKKVWWICQNGHEWEASISNRIRGRGCPVCSNKKIVAGINDLITTNPQIEKMWDYEKNNTSPLLYSQGSDKKVWWICPKCHNNWEQRINHIINGIGCPKCDFNIKK